MAEAGEGGILADGDGGVLVHVGQQGGAAGIGLQAVALGVGGEAFVRALEGALQLIYERRFGREDDLADAELVRLDLVGRGDDGPATLGILLAGDAQGEGAQPFELYVLAAVEVLGGELDDSVHYADNVCFGETGGVGDVLCHLLERDGGACHYLRNKALGFVVAAGFAARTWY